MAAPRLREPVVQMRQTLAVVKTTTRLEDRVAAIEVLMLARGMPAAVATRRLARALNLAGGELEWSFECAWEIAWQTIFFPHRKEEADFEKNCLRLSRPEFEKAWHGQPTKLEGLRTWLEAMEEEREAKERAELLGLMVA